MTETPALLFYRRVVTLDRKQHAGLKLTPHANFAFAADASLVPLLTAEFADAAREYPIVFMRGAPEQDPFPVALTGPPNGKNVYIDAAGDWNSRYVPAFVRRYPFVFSPTADDKLMVCIDEACPNFGLDEGVPLFDAAGEPSPMLQQVIGRMGEYQRQVLITQPFMKRLAASGLLVETNGKVNMDDGRTLPLRGFLTVDETRLRALPDATAKEWLLNGDLGLVYAHLLSLGNLAELLRRQPATAAS